MKTVPMNRRNFFALATAAGASIALPDSVAQAKPLPATFRAPAGIILSWAGETPPEGWMVADGRALSVTAYRDLFNQLGYVYGRHGDDFLLPDLQARAIPGHGGEAIWVQPSAVAPAAYHDGIVEGGSVTGEPGLSHQHFVNVQPTMILTQIILVEDITAELAD